jgi:hypothetical protein
VQRLFSTFPDALPGVGLFLLRLSLVLGIVALGLGDALNRGPLNQTLNMLVLAGTGICLAVGVATPFAAAVLSLLLAYEGYVDRQSMLFFWSLSGVSASLILIGPGAKSIDALLYGRKKIRIQRRLPPD